VASPVRVQPAEEAISELGRSVAELLGDMADGLAIEPDDRVVQDWLGRSRKLVQKIQRVDEELATAEDSVRLNPRARGVLSPGLILRGRLETLELATVTIRGLARSMADRTGLVAADRAGLGADMWDGDVRDRLAAVLRELAAATLALGVHPAALEAYVSEGRRHHDELGRLLREDPGHWPLHGELLVHLDRLLDGLRAGQRAEALRAPRPRARPSSRSPAGQAAARGDLPGHRPQPRLAAVISSLRSAGRYDLRMASRRGGPHRGGVSTPDVTARSNAACDAGASRSRSAGPT